MPTEKVSLRKGDNVKRAQKHKNRTVFRHNPNSKLTTKIEAMQVTALCERCESIVYWRKKYRKYKPLTVPKKCTLCDQKTVKDAYHIICRKCSRERKICEKCEVSLVNCATLTSKEHENMFLQDEEELLKYLSERQRRTYQRKRAEILPEETELTIEIMDSLRSLLDNVSFGIVKDTEFEVADFVEKNASDSENVYNGESDELSEDEDSAQDSFDEDDDESESDHSDT